MKRDVKSRHAEMIRKMSEINGIASALAGIVKSWLPPFVRPCRAPGSGRLGAQRWPVLILKSMGLLH
jgi:hypothetical protein